jgi:hypothetical protein
MADSAVFDIALLPAIATPVARERARSQCQVLSAINMLGRFDASFVVASDGVFGKCAVFFRKLAVPAVGDPIALSAAARSTEARYCGLAASFNCIHCLP